VVGAEACVRFPRFPVCAPLAGLVSAQLTTKCPGNYYVDRQSGACRPCAGSTSAIVPAPFFCYNGLQDPNYEYSCGGALTPSACLCVPLGTSVTLSLHLSASLGTSAALSLRLPCLVDVFVAFADRCGGAWCSQHRRR
jgi:hypothetical protein